MAVALERDSGAWYASRTPGPASRPPTGSGSSTASTASTRPAAATAGGSGLGLAVAGSLVRAHGGTIELDSEPGATVFTVTLPLRGGTRES